MIFCNGCGKPYRATFGSGWVHSGATARVCSKECHDYIDKAYVRSILGKPDPNTPPDYVISVCPVCDKEVQYAQPHIERYHPKKGIGVWHKECSTQFEQDHAMCHDEKGNYHGHSSCKLHPPDDYIL